MYFYEKNPNMHLDDNGHTQFPIFQICIDHCIHFSHWYFTSIIYGCEEDLLNMVKSVFPLDTLKVARKYDPLRSTIWYEEWIQRTYVKKKSLKVRCEYIYIYQML